VAKTKALKKSPFMEPRENRFVGFGSRLSRVSGSPFSAWEDFVTPNGTEKFV
jgi:hypothetical protein